MNYLKQERNGTKIKLVHRNEMFSLILFWHTSSPQLFTKSEKSRSRACGFQIYSSTYRYKSIAFRAVRFCVHDELNVVNFSKRLEDTSKHFFCDIKMKWANIQPHWPLNVFRRWRRWICVGHAIFFGLGMLNGNGNAKKPRWHEKISTITVMKQSYGTCNKVKSFKLTFDLTVLRRERQIQDP